MKFKSKFLSIVLSFLGFFSISYIVFYSIFSGGVFGVKQEDFAEQDRFYGDGNKSVNMSSVIVSGMDYNVGVDEFSNLICVENRYKSCEKDYVLNTEKLSGLEVSKSSINYFNTYAYGLLSDKYYVAGDYDSAMKAMLISIYHSERLTGIDADYYKMSMVKMANIIDSRNSKK